MGDLENSPPGPQALMSWRVCCAAGLIDRQLDSRTCALRGGARGALVCVCVLLLTQSLSLVAVPAGRWSGVCECEQYECFTL